MKNFSFGLTDYETYQEANTALNKYIYSEIWRTKLEDLPRQATLIKFTEKVTEDFFEKFGRFPSPRNLEMMADVCMIHYMKSMKANKKKETNSFLSPRQFTSRSSVEFVSRDVILDIKSYDRIHGNARPKFTQELKDV